MQFLWWLLAFFLGLYGLALNSLNYLVRSWTIHNHVDGVLRIAKAIKAEKLRGDKDSDVGWL